MTMIDARKGLENLEEYQVETVEADIIVNANENNYDMPEPLRDQIQAQTASFAYNRYPPMKAETLIRLIAADLDVDQGNVKIGNGSSELLQMACYAFGGSGRKIAVPYPSFSMYGVYAQMADSEMSPYPLDKNGFVDPEKVIAFCRQEKPSLLIVCNPNNPTGNYNSLESMEKIIAEAGCPVIMDEAYMEFAKGSGVNPQDMRPLDQLKKVSGSTLALLGKYSNFMVFRTFSKAYGLAGMRCGYAVGSPVLTHILGKVLLPYHVNGYTLMVAETVFKHRELYKERIETIISQRKLMCGELEAMGMKVWPTSTNFICCCPGEMLEAGLARCYNNKYGKNNIYSDLVKAGKYIFKALLEQRILVRDFTEHKALPGCLRISVGKPEENCVVIAKIKALCREVM